MISNLADFYTLSLFYDKDNYDDVQLANSLFYRLSYRLLQAVGDAIESELGHAPKYRLVSNMFRQFKCPGKVGRICFNPNQMPWRPLYGGWAWVNISRRYCELKKAFTTESLDFVTIDRMIDICHNTGNVLNKSVPKIDRWLSIKTSSRNPAWLIEQSNIKAYAYKRMKETFPGLSREYCVGIWSRLDWSRDYELAFGLSESGAEKGFVMPPRAPLYKEMAVMTM